MPLCMGCLNEITESGAICEICGFDNSKPQTAPYLPYGTVLNNKYVVARNLETNGESTRYLGYDKSNGKVIAIREFLPIGLFDRSAGETKLFVTPQDKLKYNKALSDFQSYYEIVAGLSDTSAAVGVIDSFVANNTAYVIEENDDLITFHEFVDHNGGHLEWDAARPLFMPLVTLIESLHKAGVGHYAVSPSNLYVTASGKLKLSGFCTENERKRGTMLKSQLYSGCAAPEQYLPDSRLDSATDIYGITATLFFALTGNLPGNAKEREKDPRLLISTNTVKRLPPHVVTALANGLQMKHDQRISDFDDLRAQLSVASTVQAIQDEISRTASMTPIKKEDSGKSSVNATAVGIVAAVIAFLLLSAAGLYWLSGNPLAGVFDDGKQPVEATIPVQEEWTGPVVENYLGKSYEDVAKTFSGTIMLSADGEYSDTVPKDCVVSQEPMPGEPVTSDSSVLYLTLSKGMRLVGLPEVAGKSYTAAAEELTELGFVVLQQVEYSSTVSEGKVIEYSGNVAGDKIESGSEVTIKVSLGVRQENQ